MKPSAADICRDDSFWQRMMVFNEKVKRRFSIDRGDQKIRIRFKANNAGVYYSLRPISYTFEQKAASIQMIAGWDMIQEGSPKRGLGGVRL